jgi:hypothetical protein
MALTGSNVRSVNGLVNRLSELVALAQQPRMVARYVARELTGFLLTTPRPFKRSHGFAQLV